MNLIKPKVEWWSQDKTWAQHVARVGRICYKSEGKQPSADLDEVEKEEFLEQRDKERCEDFVKSGHTSMLRHGTVYYFVEDLEDFPHWVLHVIVNSPYVGCVRTKRNIWISTSMQYLMENNKVAHMLSPFEVSEANFMYSALRLKCYKALNLLRMTMVVTTQISTSRELNRTSPNSIAEQSTRYVNMEKKGGVQVCRPYWYDTASRWQKMLFRTGCKVSEWLYCLLLRSGLKAQDARGVLMLDTYTVVAYTYNIYEWRRILNLRYHGTTGAPHPNAKEVAGEIRRLILERMDGLYPKFEI